MIHALCVVAGPVSFRFCRPNRLVPVILFSACVVSAVPAVGMASVGPAEDYQQSVAVDYEAFVENYPNWSEEQKLLVGTALIDELLSLVDLDTPFVAARSTRNRAMLIASMLERPEQARDIALANFHSTADFAAGGDAPDWAESAMLADFAWVVRFGIETVALADRKQNEYAGVDGNSVPEPHPDRATVLADAKALFAMLGGLDELRLDVVPVFDYHQTLVRAARFIADSGHYMEGAGAFAQAEAFATLLVESDRADSTGGWNPAYCRVHAALYQLQSGKERAAVESLLGLGRMAPMMRDDEHPAAYAQLFLTLPVNGLSEGHVLRRRVVYGWIHEKRDRVLTYRDVELYGWLASFVHGDPAAKTEEKLKTLGLVEAALVATDPRREADQRTTRRVTAAQMDKPGGYAARPVTGELHVKRFLLARSIGENAAARESAEIILTEFPDAPAMPGVASWYRRQAEQGVRP